MDDNFKFPWGKAVLWFFGIVIGVYVLAFILGILGLGASFAWLPFYSFGAKINQTQQEINIVDNGQRCIAIDAQWNTLKANVTAIQGTQIPNAEAAQTNYEAKLPKDESQWSPQQVELDGEMQTNVTGLQQELSQNQAQYNALAAEPDKQSCLGTIPSFVDLR